MLVTFGYPATGTADTHMGEASVLVVVDSGADVTMLPKRFAAPLHVDLTSLGPREINVAGGLKVGCYNKVWVDAFLCGEWVGLPIVFFAGDEKDALLGRAGAFDALRLAFLHGPRVLYAALA
jgi:hypothetical protein